MIEIGHLITGDISKGLFFKLFAKANISVGDFVLFKDKHLNNENQFIGRVTNISLSILGRSDFLADVSTQIESSFFDVDPYEFRESRPEILYKTAEVSLIGVLRGSNISPPNKIPNHLAPVFIPDVNNMKWINTKGNINIGNLRAEMTGEGNIPILLDSNILIKKHLFIAAMTGSGKSVTVKTIVSELYKQNKAGIIIFDVHGEYGYSGKFKGLKDLDSEDIKIYGLGENFDGKLSIYFDDLELSDLYYFHEWSSPQREALEIIFFNENDPFNYIKETESKDINKNYGIHKETANVIKRRINRIISGGYDFVAENKVSNLFSNITDDLRLNKVVIIDFTKVSDRSENILINIISSKLLKYNKKKSQKNEDANNIFIVLEEAQRFLDSAEYQNKGVMRELVREGRKFGIGLCAVTQIPRFFDERILSQFNTYIILKLTNSKDRAILESGSPQNISDMFTEIATLYPGEAIVLGEALPSALPVKIHNFETCNIADYKRDKKEKIPITSKMGDA